MKIGSDKKKLVFHDFLLLTVYQNYDRFSMF